MNNEGECLMCGEMVEECDGDDAWARNFCSEYCQEDYEEREAYERHEELKELSYMEKHYYGD